MTPVAILALALPAIAPDVAQRAGLAAAVIVRTWLPR